MPDIFRLKSIDDKRNNGKMAAARIPILKLSLKQLDIKPTSVGPLVHPKSPARAKKANIAVEPPFI